VSWRVLADGSVWVGRETWPTSLLEEYAHIDQAPGAGSMEIVAAEPAIYPGEVFEERRVSVVTHRIDNGRVRTRILWEKAAQEDRLKGGLLAVVRSAFPRIDFLASYPARVVAQNADGSLELIPDDARFPAVSRVPIRYGLPGVKATVAPGARVLLGFAGGDPAKPQAELWESATLLKLEVLGAEVIVGTGATQPAALATALRTELDALWTAITAHTHVVTGTLPTGPVAAVAGVATYASTKQTIASSRVKVST
jgi:hypothetical protein